MKKRKTSSNLHIAFVVLIFVALTSIITALCLFDYKLDAPFETIWQNNMLPIILAGVFVAIDLTLIISAIVLAIKNDELTRSEVLLSFMIATVLLLEVILCVPIFILWIIESIHDAVSARKSKKLDF